MLENLTMREIDDEEEDLQDPAGKPPDISDQICDAVETLLLPYEPALTPLEADKLFSTNDIISALEMHYGVPQGSADYITLSAGPKIVSILSEKGYKYANTGSLSLQWMFRKKNKCL